MQFLTLNPNLTVGFIVGLMVEELLGDNWTM
jgi:hypothetical protein